VCCSQTIVESSLASPVGALVDLTSPAREVVAAVGSAFTGLPLVIVSAGAFISALPVVSPTMSLKPLSGAVTDQPRKEHRDLPSCETTSAALSRRRVSDVPPPSLTAKSVPRLSRLNAIDLSVASSTDTDVQSRQAVSVTDSSDVDRAVAPRREIVPIPGAVCSAEEAARVGSLYLCSVCHKTFSSAPQLAVHHNIHYLDTQFRCGICRSSFSSRNSLENHRSRKHHNREPAESAAGADPRPYKCDECGVAFRIPGHLDKHKRSKFHAARLENSHDVPVPSMEDTDEQLTTGLPLIVRDDDDVTAAEETDCVAANEPQQTGDGTCCKVL